MKTAVYALSRSSSRRISIAPLVDALYWSRRGETAVLLETFPSVGQAFRFLRSSENCSGSGPLSPPAESLWEYWERMTFSLRPLLAGRSLLWDEVKRMVRELVKPMEDRELRAVLQAMCLTGMAFMLPGVEIPPAASR